MPLHEKSICFDMPASYRIDIQGYLDERWSDRLAGMHISTCIGKNQAPVATLTGRLRDQAELAGVLSHEIGHITGRHHGRRVDPGLAEAAGGLQQERAEGGGVELLFAHQCDGLGQRRRGVGLLPLEIGELAAEGGVVRGDV